MQPLEGRFDHLQGYLLLAAFAVRGRFNLGPSSMLMFRM
jgi:hypothetical protein